MKLLCPLAIAIALSSCGKVDFKLGNDDAPSTDTREFTLAPRPLNVGNETANSSENVFLQEDASKVVADFLYQSEVDEYLVIAIDRVIAVKCGGLDEVVPKLSLIARPGSEGEVETQVVATEPFFVAGHQPYAIRVEMSTSFGRCETLGLRFDALRAPQR